MPIVSSKPFPRKLKAVVASKQNPSTSIKIRVTDSGSETLTDDLTPSKRYAQLKPWFELVDLLPSPVFEANRDRPEQGEWKFPPEDPEQFLRRVDESGLDLALKLSWPDKVETSEGHLDTAGTSEERAHIGHRYRRIAIQVGRTLRSAVEAAARNTSFWHTEDLAGGRADFIEHDGVFSAEWINPLADFCNAIAGAEARRLRGCPVCGKIFYARRLSQKACSQRCNATRRVRAWRAHQSKYEQTRKEKPEIVNNKSKARGIKPRKENRK